MVEALRKVIRLRARRRAHDPRVGAGGSVRMPPSGVADRAVTSVHALTARELIAMAQAARRARCAEPREG